MKQDYEKALQFTEKALTLSPRHAEAYITQGSILLILQKPEDAFRCFKTAQNLEFSWIGCQGKIECLLSKKKHKDALLIVKELVEKLRNHPRANILAGIVFYQYPEYKEQVINKYCLIFLLN
jgi:tetratricopeptide (TPR) repeat protein